MAPKQLNHKSEIFKICSNGLAMVDYSIYNPNDDDKKHSLAWNEIWKPENRLHFMSLLGVLIAV